MTAGWCLNMVESYSTGRGTESAGKNQMKVLPTESALYESAV
jgi:hypothetical protein